MEFLVEIGLSLLIVIVFFIVLARLNRKGYQKNVEMLHNIARQYGLQLYESPHKGSIFARPPYEDAYQGKTAQYAYLRGGWHGLDLELRSISRRRSPRFSTRLSIRWTSAQSEKVPATLLLYPKSIAAQYKTSELQIIPQNGDFGKQFEVRTDNASFAATLLRDDFKAFLYEHCHFLTDVVFISPAMLYTEEPNLVVNPHHIVAVNIRLKILLRIVQQLQS
jgi:hypothetical protein